MSNISWGGDNSFYKTKRWLVIRQLKLDDNPLCELCESYNIITPAVFVDHILNRKIFPEYEYEMDNLQSLCRTCHSQKTKLEMKFKDPNTYIQEYTDGVLRYISTEDSKQKVLELIKNQ